MTISRPVGDRVELVSEGCCEDSSLAPPIPPLRDGGWRRGARWARRLAWISLAATLTGGAVGLWQGVAVGSIALIGWALGSAPEGLASAIVAWRFSGARTLSETAERRAQRGVAVSFWLTAPYIAAESVSYLFGEHHPETSVIGIVLTAVALVVMPILGRANHMLAARLGSAATAGEGTQNYLCAAQAVGALVGLSVTASWSGGWWFDPVVGLAIAAAAIWQGIRSWRGMNCSC